MKIYSQDIGMEFAIKKYAMLIKRSRKWHSREGIEPPNKKNQYAQRKGNLQIFGNIGNGHH